MKITKKLTRLLALGLTIVLLMLSLASCGGTKVADASGTAGTLGWSYSSNTKTLTITGVGAMPEVASSAEVAWASVRAGVEKVVVGDGITTVGSYAFYGMNAMTEVTLPATLTSIGAFSFAYAQKLVTVEFPMGLNAIGTSAFEGCGSLGSVFVPSGVKTIGDRAFAFCSSMTSAVIAAGEVERIGTWTFKNCTALENLVISDQLTADRVAADAFEGASKGFGSAEKNTSPNGESIIVIHYVADGVTDTKTYTHAYGDTYYYATPVKEGYTADVNEVSGTANGADRALTVTYTKDVVVETPEEPVNDEPKEEKNMGTIIFGIVIFVVVLGGIGVGAFFLLRSDKNAKNAKNGKGAKNAKNGNKKK